MIRLLPLLVLGLASCGDKDPDRARKPKSGTPTGTVSTPAGVPTGLPTTGTSGTVATFEDCDPALCTLTPGGGARGGDYCRCTIPGELHPTLDLAERNCFADGTDTLELPWLLDLDRMGYVGFAVEVCADGAATPIVATFDDVPGHGGGEARCAQVEDRCATLDADLPPAPGETVPMLFGETAPASWWDGVNDRVLGFELFDDDTLPPLPGALVISEIWQGRWLELHNPSHRTVTLDDCSIGAVLFPGSGPASYQSPLTPGPQAVPPGGWVTVGLDTNLGFATDAATQDSMPQALTYWLECAGVIVDAAPGPSPAQNASHQLNPSALDAVANDYRYQWCVSNMNIGLTLPVGEFGSPGEANPSCPTAQTEVCNDLIDNDLDGRADCQDNDCLGPTCCGDGFQLSGEECDDGNQLSGDGCSDQCEREPFHIQGCTAPLCAFLPGAGPGGADTCRCTMSGNASPPRGSLPTSCALTSPPSGQLLLEIDMAGAGYASYSASLAACASDGTSSVIAAYGTDPRVGGTDSGCEAVAHQGYTSPAFSLPANPTAAMPPPFAASPGATAWFLVEPANYGTCGNNFQLHLSTSPP